MYSNGNVKEISSYWDAFLTEESHYRGDPCLKPELFCKFDIPLTGKSGSSGVHGRALANFERHLKKHGLALD